MKSGRAALLIFLAFGVLFVPLGAKAQQAEKVWRIGYLSEGFVEAPIPVGQEARFGPSPTLR